MKTTRNILLGLVTAVATAGTVIAGGHSTPEGAAVGARQAHMQLYGFNLGILGGMAKGAVDFDADIAMAAASDLAALSKLSQAAYWIPGTTSEEFEGSRTLPAAFTDMDGAIAKATALVEAADALVAAAGTLEGVQGAMGPVGAACGACHKAYRAPDS